MLFELEASLKTIPSLDETICCCGHSVFKFKLYNYHRILTLIIGD
jgi:hypothetical protein